MANIFKSPTALDDLAEIWRYVASDNPIAADRLIDQFDAKLSLLADVPGIGRLRTTHGPDVHSFPVGKYLLFYRAVKDGIELIHVYHGARDLDALLKQPDSGT